MARTHSLWSMPSYPTGPIVRSEVEQSEAFRALEAFRQSPRGVFLRALKELTEIGYGADAERARSAYERGFSDDRIPAIPGEIANALLVLNPIAGDDARTARACLAEILLADHPMRVAA